MARLLILLLCLSLTACERDWFTTQKKGLPKEERHKIFAKEINELASASGARFNFKQSEEQVTLWDSALQLQPLNYANVRMKEGSKFKSSGGFARSAVNYERLNFVAFDNKICYLRLAHQIDCVDLAKKKSFAVKFAANPHNPTEDPKHFNGGGLASDGESLYVTNGSSNIYAITTNGEQKWALMLPNVVREKPYINGNRLFVVTVANEYVALNKDSGKIEWVHEMAKGNFNLNFFGNIMPEEGGVVINNDDGNIVKIDRSGEIKWMKNLLFTQPHAVVNELNFLRLGQYTKGDVLFVYEQNDALYLLDKASGQLLHRGYYGNIRAYWVSDNLIFLLTKDNQICVLDKHGKALFAKQFSEQDLASKSDKFIRLIVANSKLWLISEEGVVKAFEINQNFAEKFRHKLGKKLLEAVIYSDNLYLITKDFNLLRFE